MARDAHLDDLAVITNFSRGPSFGHAARIMFAYYTLLGYVSCRADIVHHTPDYAINNLHFFLYRAIFV